MARSRKVLTAAAVGVAAIALIGAGASATFTDAVHADQTITAGKMSLAISYGGSGANVSNYGRTLTLPAFGPTNSTFETNNNLITVTNTGDIPVKTLAFQMTESHSTALNNNALLAQTNVCIKSTDPTTVVGGGTWVEGNGPLTTAVALTPTVGQNQIPGIFLTPPLGAGNSMTFSVDFYAGQDSTKCGKVTSDGSGTTVAWEGYQGHAYQTPASLTNAAQGGVITPSLTFSFTG